MPLKPFAYVKRHALGQIGSLVTLKRAVQKEISRILVPLGVSTPTCLVIIPTTPSYLSDEGTPNLSIFTTA